MILGRETQARRAGLSTGSRKSPGPPVIPWSVLITPLTFTESLLCQAWRGTPESTEPTVMFSFSFQSVHHLIIAFGWLSGMKAWLSGSSLYPQGFSWHIVGPQSVCHVVGGGRGTFEQHPLVSVSDFMWACMLTYAPFLGSHHAPAGPLTPQSLLLWKMLGGVPPPP